jgi:uncharacterized protein YqgC (DUF456 family)
MNEIQIVTGLLMFAGLVGCILPVLPGPPLVWLGALFYAWRTGFETIPLWFLGILLIPMLIGVTADWWMTFLGARRGGASMWGQLASLAGGLIGFFALGFSLPGMLIGAIAALVLVEYQRAKDWNAVLKAGKGYLAGYLLSLVVETCCALIMIACFIVRLVIVKA